MEHIKRFQMRERERERGNVREGWRREMNRDVEWNGQRRRATDEARNTKGGKYHCTTDLLFDWFGISCMTTDHFCFHLENRLIQTSQTGGQLYSDTSPLSIPCMKAEKSGEREWGIE